jgi:hypothetical protein
MRRKTRANTSTKYSYNTLAASNRDIADGNIADGNISISAYDSNQKKKNINHDIVFGRRNIVNNKNDKKNTIAISSSSVLHSKCYKKCYEKNKTRTMTMTRPRKNNNKNNGTRKKTITENFYLKLAKKMLGY